ncbi:MAG: hypothetical protein Q8O91_04990 [Candidatus Aminicenantes bacterium]|nr:hypothetical protein [Candidatus Aminicenantes bacterium]
MKKTIIIGLALVFVFLGLAACKKGAAAGADAALALLPKNVQGVVVIDVNKAMTTAVVDKAIKDSKEYQKYQEFIKETGIDPQKDIYFVAIGISGLGQSGESSGSGVGVINLKYNKDTLLPKLKEKATNVQETVYEGVTIYSVSEGEGKKPMFGTFLDTAHIAVGEEKEVKAVIDVFAKKAESVLKNAELSALIDKSNKTAMVWAAFQFPPEMMKGVAASNPMASDLGDIKALQMYFDYANKSLQLEIKALGGDAEKNKKLAETLTGFKALGSMAGAEKPEIGELINKIEISSASDAVKIFANIPEDLLNKLSATATKTVEDKLEGKKTEEKKDEKTEIKK